MSGGEGRGCAPGPFLLGVDLGTTRLKALLTDRSGTVVDRSAVATPFATRGGGVEFDVTELERSVAETLGGLDPDRRAGIAGIGIAGMAESGVPLVAGRPVGPVIAWFDGRGEQAADRLQAAFGGALERRIGQRVRAVSSVAKLGWLSAHGFPVPERWLGVPETVLFLLTGEQATDYSLAARTGAYDVARRHWIPEVLEHLGLPAGLFAAVHPAGAVMGRVSEAAGVRFGVPAGVPVTVAGHDHLAAAEGLGAGPGDLLNSVGTAETLVRLQPFLPDVERALELGLAVTVRPAGDGWVVLASAARSGLVLDNLAAELGLSPGELDDRAEGAAPAPPGAGRRAVAAAPDLEVPAEGPPGEVWAAALAALSARTVAAATRSCALSGPIARLIVFGGGSRSRPWLSAKAHLFPPGTEVLAATEPQATARGAALAAGAAAGWWRSAAEGPPAVLQRVGSPRST